MPLIKLIVKHAALFYVIFVVAIAVFLSFSTNIRSQYFLKRDAISIEGKVVEPDCQRHLSFRYRFEVASVTYDGVSISERCNQIRPNERVVVHYLPSDPRINTAGEPDDIFKNNLVFIGMASLGGAAILIIIFWSGVRREKRSLAQDR